MQTSTASKFPNHYLNEAGIIDPTTVMRVSLKNAVLIARVLLLTEATLTEVVRS